MGWKTHLAQVICIYLIFRSDAASATAASYWRLLTAACSGLPLPSQRHFSSMAFWGDSVHHSSKPPQATVPWPLTLVLRLPTQHHSSSKQPFPMMVSTHIPPSPSHCSAPWKTVPTLAVPHSRQLCPVGGVKFSLTWFWFSVMSGAKTKEVINSASWVNAVMGKCLFCCRNMYIANTYFWQVNSWITSKMNVLSNFRGKSLVGCENL